jgi:hypothetical protein
MLLMTSVMPFRRAVACVAMILALLVGDGLHELVHSQGLAAGAPPANGQLEVHSGDCPHHPHSPLRPDHGCLLCQHGLDLHALHAPASSVLAPPQAPRVLVDMRAEFCAAVIVPGALGARAPPLMSV